MTNFSPFLKGVVVGSAATVLIALFLMTKACPEGKKLQELKAQVQAQEKINQDQAAAFTKDRAVWAKERAAAEAAAVIAAEEAAKLTVEIQASKQSAASSLAEADKLKSKVQPAIDANPDLKMYVNFILSSNSQKDAVIFSLEARDKERLTTIAQKDIEITKLKLESGSWETQYESEVVLNKKDKALSAELSKALKIQKLKFGIGGLALGAVVPIAYVLIHGLLKNKVTAVTPAAQAQKGWV